MPHPLSSFSAGCAGGRALFSLTTLPRDAQLGAAGTRVAVYLFCGRQHRLSGDYVEYRLFAAHAHRKVRRAGATVGERLERLLDDAVLQGVVADDRERAAGVEPADGRVQAAPKRVKLAVHLYAQRLERALGRMPSGAASRGRDGGLDDVHELPARLHRGRLPRSHDELRYAARPSLVRVGTDDPSEICCVVGVDDLCCGQGLFARIHPHIKRAVLLEGEASRRRVYLHRGHPEVEQKRVDAGNLRAKERFVQVLEVAAHQLEARAGVIGQRPEFATGGGQRYLVLIDADERARAPDELGRFEGMPCPAECCVHECVLRFEVRVFEALGEQDGCVPIFFCHFAHAL